jgi:hypothetical protein
MSSMVNQSFSHPTRPLVPAPETHSGWANFIDSVIPKTGHHTLSHSLIGRQVALTDPEGIETSPPFIPGIRGISHY